MLNLLNINKPIRVNGIVYANSQEAYKSLENFEGEITIELNFKAVQPEAAATKQSELAPIVDTNLYKVKVRQYMTKPFEFHDKYNKSTPMPMRTMVGHIIKETPGMYQMSLYAKPMATSVCMVCGRSLKNPVSVLYGIGPECGGHGNINPYDNEEQLYAEWEALSQKMADIKWQGWIPKKSIEEWEVINND